MKPDSSIIQGANIILTHHDSILLQHRDDKPTISYPNHWALPGGKREGDESNSENAIRELKEECGYSLSNPKLVLRQTVTKDNGIMIDEFVFHEEYDGRQPIQCLEGQDIKFIPFEEIPDLLMVPWQKQFVFEVLKLGQS